MAAPGRGVVGVRDRGVSPLWLLLWWELLWLWLWLRVWEPEVAAWRWKGSTRNREEAVFSLRAMVEDEEEEEEEEDEEEDRR